MHSYRRLFETLVDADHLDAAADRTVRGKRRRRDIAWFLFRREEVLAGLRAALLRGTYRPGRFQLLYLRDPKPRVIARSSVEDRIVQSAIAMLLEPIWLRSAVVEDFACRPGGGTHRALLHLLACMRRQSWAVHLDVRSYFASICTRRLLAQLSARVRDRRLLALLESILQAGVGLFDTPRARRHARMDPDWPPPGRGLPIGSTTSQLFASHVFLQGLDHFVKRELKVPGYLRYVDDLFLLGNRRRDVLAWRAALGEYLDRELDLRLKRPDARVLSSRGHIDALGWRVRRDGLEPLPAALARLRQRCRRRVRGERSRVELERSMVTALGGMFVLS